MTYVDGFPALGASKELYVPKCSPTPKMAFVAIGQ
jgi:hypothetical protein